MQEIPGRIMRYFLILCLCFICPRVLASDIFEIKIVIKEHHFVPSEIEVPANTKIRLVIENQDDTIEEFDSADLKREKVIAGNSNAAIILAPLKPGEYKFCGEFHAETAQGVLVVK